MYYRVIKDNIIIKVVATLKPIDKVRNRYPEADEVLKADYGKPGEDIRIYNEQGALRPLQDIVDEKIKEIPEGFKVDSELNEFIPMTITEKVEGGGIKLGDDEKIENNNIVKKMTATLATTILSQICFDKRKDLFPEYKYLNLLAGIEYAAPYTLENYSKTVKHFRNIYYNNKALIEKAETENKILEIMNSIVFPENIIST